MGMNDPQWGNKNNGGPGGPPDLEAVLRDLNKKISDFLGHKNGGPGGSGGGVSNNQLSGGIGLIIIVIALIWIGSGFYIVDASQRGVVLRFGKYLEATQAGPRSNRSRSRTPLRRRMRPSPASGSSARTSTAAAWPAGSQTRLRQWCMPYVKYT